LKSFEDLDYDAEFIKVVVARAKSAEREVEWKIENWKSLSY
jgi:hypothetical protein